MAAQPAPVPLMRDCVYERIRNEILSCALKPGAQVQERDLAERYRVSKSPIRDALLRLEAQNLIEVMPRKGYRVRPISVTDSRELYEMRMIVERASIARLIETASDAQLQAFDTFRKAPKGTDLGRWIGYNREFHLALAAASGNVRLARTARDVLEQFDRLTFMSVAASRSSGLARFVAEHGEIIDAVQRRDKRQASALLRDHIDSSCKRLLERLGNLAIIP